MQAHGQNDSVRTNSDQNETDQNEAEHHQSLQDDVDHIDSDQSDSDEILSSHHSQSKSSQAEQPRGLAADSHKTHLHDSKALEHQFKNPSDPIHSKHGHLNHGHSNHTYAKQSQSSHGHSKTASQRSRKDVMDHASLGSFTAGSRHQFFDGAQRGQILDVLPLLRLEDKNCVLVEAENGFGKTSIAHQIYRQTHEQGYKAHMIHGSELAINDESEVVQSLQSHLKLSIPADVQISDGAALADIYRQMSEDDYAVLVVDDAQQLSALAVTFLVDFLKGLPRTKVQLVLLALPAAPVLLADSALQDYLTDYGHQVYLRAYNSKETSEYVRFLLIAAERDDVRLSRQAMSRIYQMSAGVPARVHEALVYALQEHDQQPKSEENQRSVIVPKWHLISLSLVSAGVLALILFGNPNPSDQKFSETVRRADEASSMPDYQSPPIRFTDAQPPQPLDRESAQRQSMERQPMDRQSMEQQAGARGDGVFESGPAGEIARREVAEQLPGISRIGELEQDGKDQQAQDAMATKIAKLKAQRQVEPAAASEPAASPESSTAANTQSVASPRATASSAAAGAATSGAANAASWVRGMSPDHFTLQLLGGSNKQAIQDFVRANGSYRKMGYFETNRDGRPWYVVVYGDFPSREQAVAAANSLPNQLKSSNPWPRTARDIQSTMQ